MKIVSWVDPFTNESLEETDTHLIHNDIKYPIINGVPKFVKENSDDPQYDIEKCFKRKLLTKKQIPCSQYSVKYYKPCYKYEKYIC